MMSWGFAPYVPVAQRRAQAKKKIERLKKQGKEVFPIEIEGRRITSTFWGQSWCAQLESFSDYSNRLPRGRTYVRHGAVCHLKIAKGLVNAIVAGSKLYNVNITIAPISHDKWQSIKQSCSGKINSILDLLSGKLTEGVMKTVCHPSEGLFPLPDEIKLNCDCPDWAIMCKHVAAVLYGVGARLDNEPAELFNLRAVNMEELIDISQAVTDITTLKTGKSKRLSPAEISNIFDIDLDADQ